MRLQETITVDTHTVATLLVRLCMKAETPLSHAAHRHERAFRRVFLRAVSDAQDATPIDALVEVLSLGHSGTGAPLYVMQPVIDLLLEETHLTAEHTLYMRALTVKKPTLFDVYLSSMKSGASVSPITGMAFDVANPEAIAWAKRESADLVVDITIEARDAIRAVVVSGFEKGIPPRDVAKLIRASIGLTQRDASAVMNRQSKLMSENMSASKATERAERYAAKLTRSRAETIARTETMKAANEGQQQLWSQAREAGLLTGDEKKVWITADPCPICEELEGEVVGIDEDFSIGGDPPAHPNCRCTIGLVS